LNDNQIRQYQQAFTDNAVQITETIETLQGAPTSSQVTTAITQLRQLKTTMQQQQEKLSVAA
jgi:hypothetical protein